VALHHDPQWPRAGSWFSQDATSHVDIALLGIGAHGTAITPNKADTTPAAIREALLRYSTWNQTCQIDFAEHLRGFDFGNVKDPENQSATATEVAESIFKSDFLIALGGDNSITFLVLWVLPKPLEEWKSRSHHS